MNRQILFAKLDRMGFGGKTLSLIQSMYCNDNIQFIINGQYSAPLWLTQGVKQGMFLSKKTRLLFSFLKSFLGCNLSPLLFSLFISSLGPLLNSSGLGIDLGAQNISCLLFADDIVIIGRSQDCLDKLMSTTIGYLTKHRLSLSAKKSKVLKFDATTDTTVFSGPDSSSISLEQVLSFKYLGIHLSISPYSLFKDFNDHVRRKARTYLASVLSLVKSGPDRSNLAYTLWNCVALPSILYGSEVIPLTKGTVSEVEKCQNAVGKFILQISQSSANVSSNIDAGLKPVWAVVAEKSLLFAQSVMNKSSTYLPKLSMRENLAQGIRNPYTRYLLSLKAECTIVSLGTPTHIKNSVFKAAIGSVLQQRKKTYLTTFAMNGPDSFSKNRWFKPKTWVNDSGASKLFAEFRACNVGLGNRRPAADGQYYKLCPLCNKNGVRVLNNEVRFH